jgi:hypothetical protein
MNALRYILVVCLLIGMGSAAWADVGVAVMGPDGTIIDAITDFKTPPLRTSDKFRVVIDKHFKMDVFDYAGFRLKFHILDSKEISVTPDSTLFGSAPPPLTPGAPTSAHIKLPLVSPDFPQSTPMVQSVPFYRTHWEDNAQNSGRFVMASKWVPMAAFSLHAKNTNTGANSDVDMTVMAWCIRHLGPGQGSTTFEQSALVWAPSHFTPQPGNPLPTDPIPFDDPNGQWKHIPFPWHVPLGFPGSNFVATFAGTVAIGLEHVPEPMTALLAGSGVLMLLGSWGLRKRRMAV